MDVNGANPFLFSYNISVVALLKYVVLFSISSVIFAMS